MKYPNKLFLGISTVLGISTTALLTGCTGEAPPEILTKEQTLRDKLPEIMEKEVQMKPESSRLIDSLGDTHFWIGINDDKITCLLAWSPYDLEGWGEICVEGGQGTLMTPLGTFTFFPQGGAEQSSNENSRTLNDNLQIR